MPDLVESIRTFDGEKPSKALTALIVFSDSERTAEINNGLPTHIQVRIAPLKAKEIVVRSVEIEQPDIIIIDCPALTSDVQDKVELIRSTRACPILLFADTATDKDASTAVLIGVNAFCVNGLVAERIKSLMELAFARYAYSTALQQDLIRSKNELNDRKTIEKAKGLLMERRQINERNAYDVIRRMSMAKGKPMREIAETILEYSEFLS